MKTNKQIFKQKNPNTYLITHLAWQKYSQFRQTKEKGTSTANETWRQQITYLNFAGLRFGICIFPATQYIKEILPRYEVFFQFPHY